MNLTLASVGAIAVLILANLFTLNRWMGERDDYRDFRTRVAQAQAEAEDVARLRAEREQRILEDTARDWAAVLDHVSSRPRIVRVQQPASGCVGQVSGVPAAPSESAARPAEPRLDPEQHAALAVSVAECEQRLNNAALDAAQVMFLADWIKQQHEASK